MAYLQLRLSGTFDARIDSKPINAFRTAKARALLAYLAVEAGVVHSRASLSALLWEALSDQAAAANLRTTLSNLKKLLAPVRGLLTITRYTVEFNPDMAAIDVVDLANNPSLETIGLYQGDFLAGFSFADARPFEEWRIMHQERLHLLALLTLDELVEQEISAGRGPQAMRLIRQQLALEPWHERANYQLIRLLARQGQREAAVKQYEQCVRLLADELGLSPSPELRSLMVEIEDGLPPLRPVPTHTRPPAHNLPRQTSFFVGRQAEIRSLQDLLVQPQTPLVTITGAGGMGKTRLALEVAAQLLNDPGHPFQDGIFFIPLAPIDDPVNIPLAIAEGVGYHVHEEEPLPEQILRYLKNRAVLLLIDNFEHLLDRGRPFLLDLVKAAPRCRLLLTSRQKLNLAGETIFDIGGLSQDDLDRPDAGQNGEAERLFKLSARRVRGHYDPSPESLAAIRRLCRLVDGSPLAIVLAAAWMNTMTAREITAEIEKDIDFLASDRLDIPARQRSLRATFDYSWKLLDETDQQTYARLSVFRGGFSRQAAEAVTGTSIRRLARLVSKSLLTFDPKRRRYAIHELLRQVSEEKLADLALEQDVRRAHSRYYLEAVATREAAFRGARQQVTIHDVAADFTNVRAAWRWAVDEHNLPLLHQGLEGLFFFFFMSGREQDGVAEFERTLARLPADDRPESPLALLRARLKNRLVELTHLYRPADESGLGLLTAIFERHQAATELALLMNRRATLALQANDIPAAVHLYQAQLPIHQAAGDNFRLSATMTSIAQILIVAGQVEAGINAAEEALAISRHHQERLTEAVALITLATCDLFWRGDIDASRSRYQKVEEIGQAIRARGQVVTGLVMSKAYLGLMSLIEVDMVAARRYLEETEALWAEKKTPFVSGITLGFKSLLALTEGETIQAIETAAAGLAHSSRPGAAEMNQVALATAACIMGESRQAARVVGPLWHFVIKIQKLPERALLLYLVPAAAHLLLERGQPELALALLTAGRRQPAFPHAWAHRVPLLKRLEQRLAAVLNGDQQSAAVARGRSEPFGALSSAALDPLSSPVNIPAD